MFLSLFLHVKQLYFDYLRKSVIYKFIVSLRIFFIKQTVLQFPFYVLYYLKQLFTLFLILY